MYKPVFRNLCGMVSLFVTCKIKGHQHFKYNLSQTVLIEKRRINQFISNGESSSFNSIPMFRNSPTIKKSPLCSADFFLQAKGPSHYSLSEVLFSSGFNDTQPPILTSPLEIVHFFLFSFLDFRPIDISCFTC